MSESVALWQADFLRSQQLNERYLLSAQQWFEPLAAHLAAMRTAADTPTIVAVNGSQGSGKSTLSKYLVAALAFEHQMSALTLSLDDFYYTHAQRLQLSQTVHPLLLTRGVPGTHDMSLLNATLDTLLANEKNSIVRIPRFDKASDDRRPEEKWDSFRGAVDIIILEGWCLGAVPQSDEQLARPVNVLEEREDKNGLWRCHVNQVIQRQFLPLYQRIGQWIMLQAPSFDCVYRWRLEQEKKLARSVEGDSATGVMSDEEIAKFIQYYQRITEHCLDDLPARVNHLFRLDRNRSIVNYSYSASPNLV